MLHIHLCRQIIHTHKINTNFKVRVLPPLQDSWSWRDLVCVLWPQHLPQPLFLYFRRIKSWHKENWKVFVFTLAFSVVGLVNHVFTMEPLAPINLRPLGMKPMTIMKCLTSKDEKNKEPKCSPQQSCVYAFPEHSLEDSISIHLLLAGARVAWRKLWDWAEVIIVWLSGLPWPFVPLPGFL